MACGVIALDSVMYWGGLYFYFVLTVSVKQSTPVLDKRADKVQFAGINCSLTQMSLTQMSASHPAGIEPQQLMCKGEGASCWLLSSLHAELLELCFGFISEVNILLRDIR